MDLTEQLLGNEKILATLDADDFVGRGEQLEKLTRHASTGTAGIVVLAQPGSGCSELLRQAYDHVFREQSSRIPFYFEIKSSDATAVGVARRFFHEFLTHAIAHRRGDRRLVHSAPAIDEVAELATPADGLWVDRSIESYRSLLSDDDDRALIAGCLATPLRAVKAGLEPVIFVDGMHLLGAVKDGEYLFGRFSETLASAEGLAYVLAGRRRAMYNRTALTDMRLEAVEFAETQSLIEHTATRFGVSISDQTRDLIAVQTNCRIGRIAALLSSNAGAALDTFDRVETAYTESLLGGRLGRSINAELEQVASEPQIRKQTLQLLAETLWVGGSKVPRDYWDRKLALSSTESSRLLGHLHAAELINFNGGSIEMDPEDFVVADFVRASRRIEIVGDPRGLVFGDSIVEHLRRAPGLMARHYRKSATIGLRGILAAFDGSAKPAALFDYAKFEENYKGLGTAEMSQALATDSNTIEVPKLDFVAATAAFYPRFDDVCERERSASGLSTAADGQASIFLAVEITSKLEAKRDVADYWCDRLEMAALNAGFENHKLWLIASEGFDDEACEALTQRGAYFSNRRQVDALAASFRSVEKPESETEVRYEMTLPMGEDTELIAAHTLEEIAKRHNIAPKAINQIKTALVEAFINAAEHSLSPDRKIHQDIAVSADRIAITVTNRGIRLADRPAAASEANEDRRGWGLKLMGNLMDEVKVERTDDGTSITLIKNLPSTTQSAAVSSN